MKDNIERMKYYSHRLSTNQIHLYAVRVKETDKYRHYSVYGAIDCNGTLDVVWPMTRNTDKTAEEWGMTKNRNGICYTFRTEWHNENISLRHRLSDVFDLPIENINLLFLNGKKPYITDNT